MTQEARLLRWLADGEWHCASQALNGCESLDGPMYTFSQRASEVNAKQRGRIKARPCEQHDHKLYEYADSFQWVSEQRELIAV